MIFGAYFILSPTQVFSSQFSDQIRNFHQAKNYAALTSLYEKNRNLPLENDLEAFYITEAYLKIQKIRRAISLNEKALLSLHADEESKLNEAMKNTTVSPGAFSKNFKHNYYTLFLLYSSLFTKSGKLKLILKKDLERFELIKQKLEVLTFQSAIVSKRSEKVSNWLKQLELKIYKFRFRAFLDYLSWQTEATLKGPTGSYPLVATNVGLSPGLGVSYENSFYAFSLDANLIYGTAGVSTLQGGPTYQQSDVPAFGSRLAFGTGLIVSATRSEVGLRASLFYIKQSLSTPSTAGYSVEQSKELSETLSLYSRWLFNPFFLQTEFGRYLNRPATVWSIGFGSFF